MQTLTCTLQRASLDMTAVRQWEQRRWSAVETGAAWSRDRRRYYLRTGRVSVTLSQPASDKQLNTIDERDCVESV